MGRMPRSPSPRCLAKNSASAAGLLEYREVLQAGRLLQHVEENVHGSIRPQAASDEQQRAVLEDAPQLRAQALRIAGCVVPGVLARRQHAAGTFLRVAVDLEQERLVIGHRAPHGVHLRAPHDMLEWRTGFGEHAFQNAIEIRGDHGAGGQVRQRQNGAAQLALLGLPLAEDVPHPLMKDRRPQPLLDGLRRFFVLARVEQRRNLGRLPTLGRQVCEEPAPRGESHRHRQPRAHEGNQRDRMRSGQSFLQVVEVVAILRRRRPDSLQSFFDRDHAEQS